MNKIEINKDNYKGYVELYKATPLYDEEQMNNLGKAFLNSGKSFFVLMTALFVTPFLPLTGLIFKIVISLECLIGFSCVLGFSISSIKKNKDLRNKKFNMVKEIYPYVDTEAKDEQLEDSLVSVGILSNKDDRYPKLNVKEYENYLKCEEIKKDYLEKIKYKSFSGDTDIEYQELDFPKVKKIGTLNRK